MKRITSISALILVLGMGCQTESLETPPTYLSPLAERIGDVQYTSSVADVGLSEMDLEAAQQVRKDAFFEALSAIRTASSWEAADRRLSAMLDGAPYRDDAAARQVIAAVAVKGLLTDVAPSAERSRAAERYTEALVVSGSNDLVAMHAGLEMVTEPDDSSGLTDRVRAHVVALEETGECADCAAPSVLPSELLQRMSPEARERVERTTAAKADARRALLGAGWDAAGRQAGLD